MGARPKDLKLLLYCGCRALWLSLCCCKAASTQLGTTFALRLLALLLGLGTLRLWVSGVLLQGFG